MAVKMATTAGPMAAGSIDFNGELGGDTPSQNIVRLLLEVDNIFVSAIAAESIDSSCVDWEVLVTFSSNGVLKCDKQKTKITINCKAAILDNEFFDLSSCFCRYL